MTKAIDDHRITPMLFQRWEDEFSAPGWAKPLDGPFAIANLLQAMQDEAGAKGMGVIIQCSLCPLEWFYGPAPEPETTPPTPTGENDNAKE